MCVRRFFQNTQPEPKTIHKTELAIKSAPPSVQIQLNTTPSDWTRICTCFWVRYTSQRPTTCATLLAQIKLCHNSSCKTRNSKRRMRHCVQTRSSRRVPSLARISLQNISPNKMRNSRCTNQYTNHSACQDAQYHVFKARYTLRPDAQLHLRKCAKQFLPLGAQTPLFSKHDTSDQRRNFAWATV